jgi:hypothetical protein
MFEAQNSHNFRQTGIVRSHCSRKRRVSYTSGLLLEDPDMQRECSLNVSRVRNISTGRHLDDSSYHHRLVRLARERQNRFAGIDGPRIPRYRVNDTRHWISFSEGLKNARTNEGHSERTRDGMNNNAGLRSACDTNGFLFTV